MTVTDEVNRQDIEIMKKYVLLRCLSLRGSHVAGKIISGFLSPSSTAIRSDPVEKAWFISKNTICLIDRLVQLEEIIGACVPQDCTCQLWHDFAPEVCLAMTELPGQCIASCRHL